MPSYRVDRNLNMGDMPISEVTGLDSQLEKYLKRRLRRTIRIAWVLGGTSGFLYSERKIPRDLMRDGRDNYSFHLLSGEEAEHDTEVLGIT